MGLPLAIKAHREGNLEEAERQYRRALEQGHQEPVLFQNLGALLRKSNNTEADEVFRRGLALHPYDAGILGNRANLLRENSPADALGHALLALRQRLRQGASAEKQRDLWLTVISLLRELGASHWALAVAQEATCWLGDDPRLLMHLLLLLDADVTPAWQLPPQRDVAQLRQRLEAELDSAEPILQAELLLAIANHYLQHAESALALSYYERGMTALSRQSPADSDESDRRQNLVDVNSWNFGCTLLKQQQLQRGWQLYEYGLRTPAEGKQRWQRSLQKPFSAAELPLWRGESLAGKRLLLLSEQAIGDAMMFLTLAPTLLQEAAEIGVFLGSRLVPIYRRSFAESIRVWDQDDAKKGLLTADHYDLQCPLGSICQHRFSDPASYAPQVPILTPKASRTAKLRKAYLASGGPAQRLIGISWQGGGRPGRIEKKSTPVELFARLIAPLPGVRFVSLQYGNAAPTVQQWREQGFDVLHDPRVNPLKDMDLWLDQVAACDAVISVANTTIHGAGGLNLPTLCLLSRYSDWRWFDAPEVTRSYWYPSVGVARQQADGDWSAALQQARAWLKQGTPMPAGLQASPT